MRYIHFDITNKESYSLDSVGKHGFGRFFKKKKKTEPPEQNAALLSRSPLSTRAAMEVGPQPHGVVRSNIYAAVKSGVQHVLDWVRSFNSGAAVDQ